MGTSRIEFEAESVSYLVCSRLRLETNAEKYLAWYTGRNETIPDISLEMVLKVTGYIESLGRKNWNCASLRRQRQRTGRKNPAAAHGSESSL